MRGNGRVFTLSINSNPNSLSASELQIAAPPDTSAILATTLSTISPLIGAFQAAEQFRKASQFDMTDGLAVSLSGH